MKQSTDELRSAELGALDGLLRQIERSASHYEVLSVERSASDAQMSTVHEQAAALLPARDVLAATPAIAHEPGRGKCILVADDDLSLRRVLGKILTAAGYEAILVEDGKAAIEKAAEVKPDLVITDGLMPKMHGFLVCKALKELRPAPKVIMLTAVYTKLNYRFEARDRYGADELLTKPFEVANLLKCIERHLGLAHPALAG